MTEFALLAGQLFNGISVASILLLAALGLALSFGLMRVINMAHGEILMMGGYLTYVYTAILAARHRLSDRNDGRVCRHRAIRRRCSN